MANSNPNKYKIARNRGNRRKTPPTQTSTASESSVVSAGTKCVELKNGDMTKKKKFCEKDAGDMVTGRFTG